MDECVMYQTGVILTMACNLKCRLCSSFAPYYAKPAYYTMDFLREQLRRYFAVVTHIHKLMVTGGEPFLHPDLERLIDEVRLYRDRVDVFGVITNGGILPTEGLLRAAREFGEGFHFLIDDYGPELSVHAGELDRILTRQGIPHILRAYRGENAHCGGWVDFGDLTRKKQETPAETEARYAKCAYPQKLRFAFDLVDGAMYPCGPSRRCKELGVADRYDEYIDLFDDTLSIAEQRRKIAAIYRRKSLTACAYCNGMSEDSPRFLSAEQLTPGQLARVRAGARQPAEAEAGDRP